MPSSVYGGERNIFVQLQLLSAGHYEARKFQARINERSIDKPRVCNAINIESAHTHSITAMDIDRAEGRFLISADTVGHIAIYDTLILPITTLQPKQLDDSVTSDDAAPAPVLIRPLHRDDEWPKRRRVYSTSTVDWYPIDTGAFVSGQSDGTVDVWDTNTLTVAHTFNLKESVFAVALSPLSAHTLIAVGNSSTTVRLCDPLTGAFSHALIGHTAGVTAIDWSPESEFSIVTGSIDQVRHCTRT